MYWKPGVIHRLDIVRIFQYASTPVCSRRRSSMERMTGTTERITRHAPCPVLVA